MLGSASQYAGGNLLRSKLSVQVNCLAREFSDSIHFYPFKIASHLTPQDLLHMARSCRMMRDLFMSKRSLPIWRTAREALGMPECPPDLSEPQYADLVFFKGCYVCFILFLIPSSCVLTRISISPLSISSQSCGAGRAQTLHFTFRLRLCRQCSDTQ